MLGGQPQVYLTRTINFGERASGCYAIAALKMTALVFGSHSLEEVRDMHVTEMVQGANVQAKPKAWRKDTAPVFEDGVLQLPQASVAAKIELDSYVDDQLTGNKARPEAEADMDEADNIIGNGGFRYKSKTYTTSLVSFGTRRLTSCQCFCLPTIWARRKARSWDHILNC